MAILDESTRSGGVGASISAIVSEELYDELDAPVRYTPVLDWFGTGDGEKAGWLRFPRNMRRNFDTEDVCPRGAGATAAGATAAGGAPCKRVACGRQGTGASIAVVASLLKMKLFCR